MTFRVEMSAQAENDAERILEWLLSKHAGETGVRWFLALEEAIASLGELPKRCPLAPENSRFPFEVRQLLYGRKPHIYRILESAVSCLATNHSRRHEHSKHARTSNKMNELTFYSLTPTCQNKNE